jgi:tryptophan synthase alpha chain
VAAACKARGLSLIMICAPTSDAARRDRIRAISAPFVYYQAVAGITGERSSLPADLPARVAELRGGAAQRGATSVCVGFGISAAAQVREVCRVADGAIVGSAIVRRINEAIDAGKADASIVDAVAGFVDELAEGAA